MKCLVLLFRRLTSPERILRSTQTTVSVVLRSLSSNSETPHNRFFHPLGRESMTFLGYSAPLVLHRKEPKVSPCFLDGFKRLEARRTEWCVVFIKYLNFKFLCQYLSASQFFAIKFHIASSEGTWGRFPAVLEIGSTRLNALLVACHDLQDLHLTASSRKLWTTSRGR